MNQAAEWLTNRQGETEINMASKLGRGHTQRQGCPKGEGERGGCLGEGAGLATAEGELQCGQTGGEGGGGGRRSSCQKEETFPKVQRWEELFPFVSQSCARSDKAHPLQL